MGRNRNKKEFTRKPTDRFLYRWTPETDLTKKKKAAVAGLAGCYATPNSQGADYDVTYVYEIVNINGVANRIAYVACDYVE